MAASDPELRYSRLCHRYDDSLLSETGDVAIVGRWGGIVYGGAHPKSLSGLGRPKATEKRSACLSGTPRGSGYLRRLRVHIDDAQLSSLAIVCFLSEYVGPCIDLRVWVRGRKTVRKSL